MKKYIALIPKNNLKEGRKKKSVIILAASVLAAVGSHKKERAKTSDRKKDRTHGWRIYCQR